jgi:hypothetical protein
MHTLQVKRAALTFLALAAILCAVCWHFRAELGPLWRQVQAKAVASSAEAPVPDAARYAVLKEEAERWRKELAERHAKAKTTAGKDAVLAETRRFLETLLPEMMDCWLGTPWDFHGTAEAPGQGKIACGYFVATVLRDAGFRVDRYKLARQPSQNILRSFLPRDAMDLKVGVPYDTYAAGLRTDEPGIRIVGLDSHVAFLVTRPEGFRFIHSSGSKPWCVVNEDEGSAEVLRRSNYRVQGLLTSDRDLLRGWLAGKKIKVAGHDPARASAANR